MPGVIECSIHRRTQIDSDHFLRILSGEKQVATLAAARVQQDLPAETLRRVRRKVPTKVGLSFRTEVGKVPPFITEAAHRPQLAVLTLTGLGLQLLFRMGEEI